MRVAFRPIRHALLAGIRQQGGHYGKVQLVCPQLRSYSEQHQINSVPESAVLHHLKSEVKAAMRAKDKMRLNCVKDVLAQVLNATKAAGASSSNVGTNDNQVYNIIRSSISKRRDSARAYRDNRRPELAETEEAEAQLLEAYLPKQMSEQDLQAIVVDLASRIGAGQKDLGKVLKALASEVDESVAPKSLQAAVVKKVLAGASSKNVPA